MSLELTENDRFILEKYRLERLQSLFSETLPFCWLYLHKNQRLTIHCSEPWMVDQLINQIEQLRWCVKVILGVKRLSICFAEEEIYKTVTTQSAKKRRVKSGV